MFSTAAAPVTSAVVHNRLLPKGLRQPIVQGPLIRNLRSRFELKPWQLDGNFPKPHKLDSITANDFLFSACSISTSFAGGKHHMLLVSLVPVPKDSRKFFFGQEEIVIPVHSTIEAAYTAHPTADVFINFASFRSAVASSMSALKQPTIRVVAIIAEDVPESDTKQLIALPKLKLNL